MSKLIDLVGLSRFLSKCKEVFIRKPKKTFTTYGQGVWFNRRYEHLYRIMVYSEADVISVIVECGDYAWPKAKLESSECYSVDDLVLRSGAEKIFVYYHCGAADPWIIVTDITNGEQVSLNKCDFDSVSLNYPEITIDRTQSKLTFDTTPTANSSNPVTSGGVKSAIDTKQNTLVSGTNIKTINNESLLGSGNIAINVDTESLTTSEIDTIWNNAT